MTYRANSFDRPARFPRGSSSPTLPKAMDGASDTPHLSAVERDVLGLMVEGADGGTISKRLGISRAEVRTHVSVILNKLGVNSHLQAAARYWRLGNDIVLFMELRRLPREDRELLLRWLVADSADREGLAAEALKRRTESADVLAELIQVVTMLPEQRQRFIRILEEIQSEDG
jgi:DNA-binding CsgD family transcriptional regulator